MLITSSIYHNWAHLNDTQRPSFLKAFLSSWMPVKIPVLCDSPLTAGPAVSPFSTSSSCPLTSSPSTPPYSHLITDLPLHHHPPISSPSSHLITILPISPPPSHLISVFPISPPPSHLIANLPPHHHPPISPPPSHLISVFPTAPSLPQHHHLLPTGSSGALDSSAPLLRPPSPQQFNCHLQSPLTIPCS